MPVGDVRVNPQTGQTFELVKQGNARVWSEIEGEKAALAQQSAQLGTPGAFLAGAAGAFGDVQPVGEAQRRQFPVASGVGTGVGMLSQMGAPGAAGVRAGRALKGATASERVVAGVEAGVAKSAADRLIRRPSNILNERGATTAGGAARILEAGADAVPGLNLLGLGQKAFNRKIYNEGLVRAMGVSDDVALKARTGITPDVRKAIRTQFAKDFGEVFDAVGNNADQLAARAILDTGREAGWVGRNTYSAMQNRTLTGADLKDIREGFSKVLRNQNESQATKNAAADLIEEIDDVIARSLGDEAEALQRRYAETRARWRVWRQARTGRGLSADNQVNPISMDGRLRSQSGIGDSYGAGEPITNGTPALNDFLELMRSGSTIETGLQSSGTAERLIGVGALGGVGAAILN